MAAYWSWVQQKSFHVDHLVLDPFSFKEASHFQNGNDLNKSSKKLNYESQNTNYCYKVGPKFFMNTIPDWFLDNWLKPSS